MSEIQKKIDQGLEIQRHLRLEKVIKPWLIMIFNVQLFPQREWEKKLEATKDQTLEKPNFDSGKFQIKLGADYEVTIAKICHTHMYQW